MTRISVRIETYEVLQINDHRLSNPGLPGIEAMSCAAVVELSNGKQFLLEFVTTKSGPAVLDRSIAAEEFIENGFCRAGGYLEMTKDLHDELVVALDEAGVPGQMQSDEFDHILIRTHLTASAAAKLLGVSAASADKWLSGERAVSAPVGRIMRVIAASDDIIFSLTLPALLAKAGGEMNNIEFSLALDMLSWNHDQAAHILGLSTRTFKNWATGDRRIFQPVARLLRVLVRQGPAYTAELSRLLIEAAMPINYPPALIQAA